MIIVGNNNAHNLKGDSELTFTNEMYNNVPQPIISLILEKTKIGGTKYVPYFYKIHGPINKLEEIKPGTLEYQNILDLHNAEMSKYQNRRFSE